MDHRFQSTPQRNILPTSFPALTTAQLAKLYQQMSAEYHVSALQRVETSGLRVAEAAQALLRHSLIDDLAEEVLEDRPISILAGLDSVGAVGLIAARHLEEWGSWVQVVTTHPIEAYHTAAATTGATPETVEAISKLLNAGVATAWAEDGWELPPADLIIDALPCESSPMGANSPSASYDLIQLVNSHQAPVLSIVMPAGFGPDTGLPSEPTLSAAATLALGYPTSGLLAEGVAAACGDLYLADIGIPDELYSQMGVDKAELFAQSTLIHFEKCAR